MHRFFLVLVFLSVGGCTNAEFTPSPGAGTYAAYKGKVQVLTGFPAEGTYKRLGILIARGVRLSDKEDLVKDLKSEAAKRGANAIILQGDVKSRRNAGGTEEKSLGAFVLRLKP